MRNLSHPTFWPSRGSLWSLLVLSVVVVLAVGIAALPSPPPPSPTPPVAVFEQGEEGYFCIKIPDIITTLKGTLLAFGEARKPNCADHTWIDLVVKRSEDGGATWSALQVVYSNSTETDYVTIGNAAPVVDRNTGRILVPFCRNNAQILLTYSDDDGLTWSSPRNLTGVVKPSWKWVGTGPPAGLQLASGRILIPSYHDPFSWDDGEFSRSYVMYSDDGGETWQLGGELHGLDLSNECQAAEISPDYVILSARGIRLRRLQAYSTDGGLTWGPTEVVQDLPEPLEGVEGSILFHPPTRSLLLSNPSEASLFGLRYNMSIHYSPNNGSSWLPYLVLDPSAAAYSALTLMPDGETVGILYEVSNVTQIIFTPQQIVFQTFTFSPPEIGSSDHREE